jgi:hypothetical protein
MHDAAEELRTATTQPDIANVARSKHRDPRFAELDAQNQTAKADREQRPAARKRKRQRAGPALPRTNLMHTFQTSRVALAFLFASGFAFSDDKPKTPSSTAGKRLVARFPTPGGT